ncbi:uncharacterized protein LOC108671916, partial [Hyalella azteca]|uniref:Uncharacterized protein LOC108671916 n=1 Tax=Hyalella azteca TaxID=294128 RepID=A0A8B7NMV5_HYAAZ
MRSAGPQPQVRAPRPAAQQQQQQFRGIRPAGGPQHPSPITDAPSAWQRSPHVAMLPLPQPGPTTSRQAAPPLPPQQQQPAPTVRPEQPPATHVSRAYCRGTERVQSAIRSAQQTSGEASLPLQMSALSVEQANSGNGSNGNGSNGNGTTSSRGHSRGGHFSREDAKQMILRPHNNSKIGTGKLRRTNDMNLLVNYFEMEKCQDWRLNFYAVIYNPAQDDRRQRYKIMEPHLKHFGGHVFDGMNIFSRNLLPNKETVFSSTTSDGDYSITVKFVRELDSLDDQFIRILNLILRRCQAAIETCQVMKETFMKKIQTRVGKEFVPLSSTKKSNFHTCDINGNRALEEAEFAGCLHNLVSDGTPLDDDALLFRLECFRKFHNQADKNDDHKVTKVEFDNWTKFGFFNIVLAASGQTTVDGGPDTTAVDVIIDDNPARSQQVKGVKSIIKALIQGNTGLAIVNLYGLLTSTDVSNYDPLLITAVNNAADTAQAFAQLVVAVISGTVGNISTDQIIQTLVVAAAQAAGIPGDGSLAIYAVIDGLRNNNTAE